MSSPDEAEFSLTFHERPDYLHVIVTGVNGADAALASGQEIMAKSKALGVEYVIIEDQSDGPGLEPIDTFAWLSEISKSARSVFKAVAVVGTKIGQDKQFAESVAVNRGLNFALFQAVHKAEQWLLGQIAGA